MVAGGAVGQGGAHLCGLDVAGAVGGAGADDVFAGVGVEVEGPEAPGEGGEFGLEFGGGPGGAIVGADLDASDAAVAGEGDALNTGAAGDGAAAARGYVDAGHGVDDALLRPAALLPVALDVVAEEGEAGDPLGVLDAVAAGGEEADGEAVLVGQGLPVHLPDEADAGVADVEEGVGLCVVVGGGEPDVGGFGANADGVEHGLE